MYIYIQLIDLYQVRAPVAQATIVNNSIISYTTYRHRPGASLFLLVIFRHTYSRYYKRVLALTMRSIVSTIFFYILLQAPHASGALRSVSLTNPLHRPLVNSAQKYQKNDLQIVRAGRRESPNTRFWNVPNVMSVGRLLSVPPFIAAMAMKQVIFIG